MYFRVGDRVLGTKDALSHRVGKLGRVTRLQGKSSAFVLWDGEGGNHFVHVSEIFRIEEKPMRNEDKPKIWLDMTPEEKGALLLAKHEGKVIEVFGLAYPDEWYEDYDPCFNDDSAYRIEPEPEPEPKREMVEAKLCIDARGTSFHMRPDFRDNYYDLDDGFYFTMTFDIIDGKPDPSSIKIEEV